MSIDPACSVPGIVRNGVIVPQLDHALPEGSHVEILLDPTSLPTQVTEELAAWDRASEEAWNWIEEIEAEKE